MNFGNWLAYTILGSKTASHIPRRRRSRARRGPKRDGGRREFARTFPCCACGRPPRSEAAHTGTDGGMSQKSSDDTTVPLCRECHWEYDNGKRSKRLFEEDHGISMARIARDLNRDYYQERMVA